MNILHRKKHSRKANPSNPLALMYKLHHEGFRYIGGNGKYYTGDEIDRAALRSFNRFHVGEDHTTMEKVEYILWYRSRYTSIETLIRIIESGKEI